MKFKTEKIKNKPESSIEIIFDSQDLEQAFEEYYMLKQKTASVAGFRKGKVPLQVLKNKFSKKEIQVEAFNRLIEITIRKIAPDLEPKIFSFPQLQMKEYNENESLIIEGTYETDPEIKIYDYKNIKIDIDNIRLEDSDIDIELKSIQKKFAKKQLAEDNISIANTSLVHFMWSEGEKEDQLSEKKETTWTLGENEQFQDFEKNLIGLKKDESKKFSYTYSSDSPYDEIKGKTFFYDITVKEIYQVELPEINDELAKEYDENLNSLDELKTQVKEKLTINLENFIKKNKIDEIFDVIVKNSTYEIPQSLIDQEANFIFKNFLKNYNLPQELTLDELGKKYPEVKKDELAKNFRDNAETKFKFFYIKKEIAEKEKIEITEEDIKNYIEEKQKNSSQEEKEKILNDDTMKYQIKDMLESEKIGNFLYENSEKKETKEITYSEFLKKQKGNP